MRYTVSCLYLVLVGLLNTQLLVGLNHPGAGPLRPLRIGSFLCRHGTNMGDLFRGLTITKRADKLPEGSGELLGRGRKIVHLLIVPEETARRHHNLSPRAGNNRGGTEFLDQT